MKSRCAVIVFIYLFYTILGVRAIGFAEDGTAGQAGAYLKMGVDARASGMGSAYVAAASDAAAVFWNPAGLAKIFRQQIGATYTLFPEGGDYSQLVYAMPLNVFSFPVDEMSGSAGQKDLGTLGVSLIRYAAKYDIEARQIDSINPDYLFSDIEGCYQIAYGLTLVENISLGISAKGLYHMLDQENANGWGMDAGIIWDGVPGLRLAAAVRDVYSQLYWTTGTREVFPAVLKIGAAYQYFILPEHAILVSSEFENNLSDMPTKIHVGLEYGFNQLIFIRGGYNHTIWTVGGGLRISRIGWGRAGLQLDYAAQENHITGWNHWMSMKVLF